MNIFRCCVPLWHATLLIDWLCFVCCKNISG